MSFVAKIMGTGGTIAHILRLADVEGAEADVVCDLEASDKLKFVRKMVLEYDHHMDPLSDCLSGFPATLERNRFGYQFASNLRLPFPTAEVKFFVLYAYSKEGLRAQ